MFKKYIFGIFMSVIPRTHMYMLQDKKSCKKNLFQLINLKKKEKYSAIFQFSKNAYRCVFFINSLLYYLLYFHANC